MLKNGVICENVRQFLQLLTFRSVILPDFYVIKNKIGEMTILTAVDAWTSMVNGQWYRSVFSIGGLIMEIYHYLFLSLGYVFNVEK